MKKIILLFVPVIIVYLNTSPVHAQCAYDNYLIAEGDAPQVLNDQVYSIGNWAGEMIRVTNMKGGNTYSISTCESYFYFDSEITVYPAGGGSPVAYDDDGCGLYEGPSYVEFTPSQNGDYDILLDEYPCQSNVSGMNIYITLIEEGSVGTGAGCGIPATVASLSIPVVVHVLYKTAEQNISDDQIMSQIAVLNCDFRKVNGDFQNVVPGVFQGLGTDMGIEFCLASVDPDGDVTSGITRTQTNVSAFTANENGAKHSNLGGHDNWDPTRYLNIWVCNLGGGLLGYATFPADLQSNPDEDGVVIGFTAFGNTGSVAAPYNQGRTATHEVGHWLNLRHVWGDAACGNDFVDDTPTQEQANYSCMNFPHVTCNNGPNGDLFVNFMDYSDDACMAMFTNGQGQRANATTAGSRNGLSSSAGCGATVGIQEIDSNAGLTAYPNPNNGIFRVKSSNVSWNQPTIEVYDILGKKIMASANKISSSEIDIELNSASKGIYFISVSDQNKTWRTSILVN
ncbi:MAG: M43 family zinc metalloprotease [Chitinophagales bacterium]